MYAWGKRGKGGKLKKEKRILHQEPEEKPAKDHRKAAEPD